MNFADLGVQPSLLKTLEELKHQQATPIQIAAIPPILAGQDVLAAAQTGTGKTAAFALPLLQTLSQMPGSVGSNAVRALVLVPTRELAEQVSTSFRDYGAATAVRVYAVYGGVSINPQMMRLRRGVDILVATPGRLLDLFRQNAVKFRELSVLVLDEADRMLDLGFAQELDILLGILPKKRQTLLFSATFSEEIRSLAKARLRDPKIIEVSPRNTAAHSVRQWVVPVDKKRKSDLLLFMLKDRGWLQALVFVKTKKGVDELVTRLLAKGWQADAIHGDRPQPARLRALAAFKEGALQILVATDVAARGLDIEDMPLVINFDLPLTAEDYVHRIGRTGRAGREGEAVSFVCADEVAQLQAIESLIKQKLSRDEEPGFEPVHRLPQSALPQKPMSAAPKTGSPRTRKGVPDHWVGFDAGWEGEAARKKPSAGRRPRPRSPAAKTGKS